MYYTYILTSQSLGRYYIGSTKNLAKRVEQHDDPNDHGSKTTKRANQRPLAIGLLCETRDAISSNRAGTPDQKVEKQKDDTEAHRRAKYYDDTYIPAAYFARTAAKICRGGVYSTCEDSIKWHCNI